MSRIINFLNVLYSKNKFLFLAAIFIIVVFVVGCSVQSSGAPPPSGPIGGGCG